MRGCASNNRQPGTIGRDRPRGGASVAFYNGVVRLDAKGEAWVNLPDYFEALNGDFRYQLTAIGAPAPRLYVAREVSQNRFKIALAGHGYPP